MDLLISIVKSNALRFKLVFLIRIRILIKMKRTHNTALNASTFCSKIAELLISIIGQDYSLLSSWTLIGCFSKRCGEISQIKMFYPELKKLILIHEL